MCVSFRLVVFLMIFETVFCYYDGGFCSELLFWSDSGLLDSAHKKISNEVGFIENLLWIWGG